MICTQLRTNDCQSSDVHTSSCNQAGNDVEVRPKTKLAAAVMPREAQKAVQFVVAPGFR